MTQAFEITPEVHADIERRRANKESWAKIAASYGVEEGSLCGRVYRVRTRLGHRPKPTKERDDSWDFKVFEPYPAFKARRQREREEARANG